MPTLCLEVSLAFLEGARTELRPEGYRCALDSCKEPTIIPNSQLVRSVGPGQAGPEAPAQDLVLALGSRKGLALQNVSSPGLERIWGKVG